MSEVNAVVEWQDHSDMSRDIELTCTIKYTMENAFDLAKDWMQTAPTVFLQVLERDFAFEQIDASPEAWQMYYGRIGYVKELDHNKILVNVIQNDCVVRITGLRSEVEKLSAHLKDDLSKVQDEISRAAMMISETKRGFTMSHLRMLQAKEFVSKQLAMTSPVKVEIDMERMEVSFTGLPDDVESAKTVMYDDILNRMTERVIDMSCSLVSQTGNTAMMTHMSRKFHERNIVAMYYVVGDSKLAVYALSEDHLKVAIETVRSETDERAIDDPPVIRLATKEWNGLIKDLQSQHEGLLKVNVFTKRITVTGATQMVAQAEMEIKKYLAESDTSELSVGPGRPNPIDPSHTNPVDPGRTNPVGPGSTNPVDPGRTNPVGPGSTNPVDPGRTNPVGPGSTNPFGSDQKSRQEENATSREFVGLVYGKADYMERYMKKETDGIRHTPHRDSVEIIGKMDEPYGFTVKGTGSCVNEAVLQLQKLASEIKAEQFSADKPGMSNFLYSPAGQLSLSLIESQHKVTIKPDGNRAPNGSGGSTVVGTSAARDTAVRSIVTLPRGVTVEVVRGDLTMFQADAIVNPANDELKHRGGLAKAIVNAGSTNITIKSLTHMLQRYPCIPQPSVNDTPVYHNPP